MEGMKNWWCYYTCLVSKSGRAGGAIHEMKMKSIALDLFFCFSKGEKDLFQKKRFWFKKNHLKRISLK